MRENEYQKKLIKKIRTRLPGCVVLKNDSDYLQGIPDLTVLHGGRWGVLEVKASASAPDQPNQDYYVNQLNDMSFGAFIHPQNEEEVLDALQRTLQSGG